MLAGLASNRIPMAYGGGGGILGVEVSATGLKIVATFIGRVMNDLVARSRHQTAARSAR